MSRTRIKMCGTTNVKDAEAAVFAGVDALGFIFVKKSPRNIQSETAKEIISSLPPFINLVGVFVDRDLREVEELVKYTGLSYVQLHGEEEPEYCEELAFKLPTCKMIKAFRVGDKSKKEDFSPYNQFVTGFLLDTYVKDKEGGTGLVFDWNLIKQFDLQRPCILAGGLNPENVVNAIEAVHPFAIDINSGVELEPGRKDHAKLRLLTEQVRWADHKMLEHISGR